jgi:hypothetical protein
MWWRQGFGGVWGNSTPAERFVAAGCDSTPCVVGDAGTDRPVRTVLVTPRPGFTGVEVAAG